MARDLVRFGDFELDPANYELRRGSNRIKMERIPMELLILLANNDGKLVHRSEVVEVIWGKDCFLESDSAINTAIRKLRRVLGDHPRDPVFIETVPGKGYRFLKGSPRQDIPVEAKALYSRGLHFWNRKTPESYIEAIKLFQRSIDVDPCYSLPYLGLAKTWILFGIHGLQPAHDVYPRARAAVSKALELDCDLAEAHAVMADIVKGYDWDWVGAKAHYLRALQLDPQCGVAHQWYANLLSITGRHEEALQHAMKARTLDPLSVGAAGFVAFTYLRARRYREALGEAESAVTLEPNSPIANWFLGHVLAALKRFQDASSVLLRAVEQSQSASMYVASLAYVYAESGNSSRASEMLIHLQRRSLDRYVSPLDIAIIYTALGQLDAAFEYLAIAFEQRIMRLTELAMPTFDSLRMDARFPALLSSMLLSV